MDSKTIFWIGQTPNWPRPSEVCRYSLERFGVDVNNIPIYYGDNVSNPFSRTRFLTPVIDKLFSDSQWMCGGPERLFLACRLPRQENG